MPWTFTRKQPSSRRDRRGRKVEELLKAASSGDAVSSETSSYNSMQGRWEDGHLRTSMAELNEGAARQSCKRHTSRTISAPIST